MLKRGRASLAHAGVTALFEGSVATDPRSLSMLSSFVGQTYRLALKDFISSQGFCLKLHY